MHLTNRFGSGEIYTLQDLSNRISQSAQQMIYCTSTACMSVTSDMLSWISGNDPKSNNLIFVSKNAPNNNNVIIVLGCQVTDLAILNDIRTVERLHEENPDATVYMGGCLAYRFDIELPDYVLRLAATRKPYQEITKQASDRMGWERPFWVKASEWKETDSEFSDGHIFRDMYPMKIGAGCHGKCKYCTIRDTRGESFETDAFLQVKEFLDHDDVVLISDSPSPKQINDWAYLAKRYNKPISIRNVEPYVTVGCAETLSDLSANGLLRIFHCPIQSNNEELLRIMNRDVKSTFRAIEIMQLLRMRGVKVATNIIIDYTFNGKTFKNMDVEWLNDNFDYWSWNPYFDGHWDRQKAEERFKRYIYEKGAGN